MPQVTVTIAGHTYRIACAEGEEAHLEGLAAAYDARVEEMRGTFGEIGDLRLHVMAAIAQADELHEAKQADRRARSGGGGTQQRQRRQGRTPRADRDAACRGHPDGSRTNRGPGAQPQRGGAGISLVSFPAGA